MTDPVEIVTDFVVAQDGYESVPRAIVEIGARQLLAALLAPEHGWRLVRTRDVLPDAGAVTAKEITAITEEWRP